MITTSARLVLVAALAACGSNGTSAPADAPPHVAIDARAIDAPIVHDAPTATGSTLALAVPGTYSGAPRQLAVVTTSSVPLAGPPAAVLLTDTHPTPTAGHALAVVLDTSAITGDYYIVAVLYQQGGGQYAPKSGVDYVAQSAAKFHFTGAPIDLGTLDLALAP